MSTSNPVQVSENCWKHTDKAGNVYYRKTSDPKSELHQEDGPTVEFAEYSDGTKCWYYQGKKLNVSSQEEFEEYLKNHDTKEKKTMSTSNPVQISENCWKYTDDYGNCFYTKTSDPESDIHREDGPAVECSNGDKEWWINGNIIPVDSQKEFEEYLKKHEVKKIVVKEEVSDKDPVFIFRMEFNYSCKSKEDLSKEKMLEAFSKQLEKVLN